MKNMFFCGLLLLSLSAYGMLGVRQAAASAAKSQLSKSASRVSVKKVPAVSVAHTIAQLNGYGALSQVLNAMSQQGKKQN